MAHKIESMMYANETPWHGLGTKVEGALTSAEALKAAGLDWEVELADLKTDTGTIVTHKATRRATDKKIFGVVGPKYHPLQNREAFEWFDPFVSDAQASFETAGSLSEGKRIWALAKLNRDPIEVVRNDIVEKFLLLSNCHDGTMSVRCGFTPIRVVCANTLAMAEQTSDSSLIRVMHSKNVKQNLEMVRDLINTANEQFEATAEQYKALAKRKVNKKDLDRYVVQVFFPQHETTPEEELSDRARASIHKMNMNIQSLFESGKGSDIKGVRGTYWGLYNSVTEYLSYHAIEDQNQRLDSLWFNGRSKGIADDALDLALEYATR